MIQTAIECYNEQADKMCPKRPKVTWKEIADYTFLGEFNLLLHCEDDVQKADWAQPQNRLAMVTFFKLCWARKELVCVGIEVR